jgi:hypothetical protein
MIFDLRYPERRDELASLMNIAECAERTLMPIAPAPAFRARLRAGLMMAAHHQQVHHVLVAQRTESQWGWLLGAAALGSAAGLIAMVLHARAQGRNATVAPSRL